MSEEEDENYRKRLMGITGKSERGLELMEKLLEVRPKIAFGRVDYMPCCEFGDLLLKINGNRALPHEYLKFFQDKGFKIIVRRKKEEYDEFEQKFEEAQT
jgi:hypothetical protein